jgi:metal-responsive CopG/Arc/MetJ family transcriptional regulator
MKENHKLISVAMPEDLLEEVKQASKDNDMSMTAFIKYVLRMYLSKNDRDRTKE